MKAQALHLADGKPAAVYYCGECRTVARTEDDAEACCRPRLCECGAECERYWTICPACRSAKEAAREDRRFAKAAKVYAGDYAKDYAIVDGEFVIVDDLDDHCNDLLADWIFDGGKPWEWQPPRVYGARAVQHSIDVDGAIDRALDDSPEGAYDDLSQAAIDELREHVDAWCQQHMPTTLYEDASVALLPWPPESEVQP